MKKTLCILLITYLFLVSSVSGAFAAPRHSPNFPPHPIDILAPLGFGLITGAIIVNTIREQQQQAAERQAAPPEGFPPPNEDEVSPAPPPELVISRVTITAEVLNVRSGPGLDQEIVSQGRQGEILDVIRSERDWLYVRTTEGLYGWVMAKFTVLQTKPQG
jgi:uncharacterized protein YgiM (DUF1202 family)